MEINDLDFIDDDEELYSNSFSSESVIVDNDDWDESSGNIETEESFNENNVEDSDTFENNDIYENSSEQTDAISELLKARGINDSSKIKFTNESGEIEERNWKDLSVEEQINIIDSDKQPVYNPELDLDDNEIDLINRIRLSRMSVDDYLSYERQKGISQYVASQKPQEMSFAVDDLSDDELYILDLQTKIEDITDEELATALEQAKSNETLFNKQIAGLRNEYRALEQNKINSEIAIQEQARQEQFAQFSNSIINSINNFTNIGDLDVNMEDEDAQQLYNFITGTDSAGINYFAKALNDPDTLTKVAWFALHGEDIFNSISDYYNNVIQQVSKNAYEKGKNSVTKKHPDVVINPTKNNNRRTDSIYDLD